MSKRANSEGSVFEMSDGRWRAQISLGGGRYKTRTVATQAAAVKALRELTGEQDSGPVVSGDLRVSDLIDEWQRKNEAASTRTAGTKGSNVSHLAAWRNTIGRKTVARLTVEDIETALEQMSAGRARPLSRSTMIKRRSLLSQVFVAGIRRGKCRADLAAVAVLPADSWDTEARRSFTADQANAIIRATEGRRNGAAYLVGMSLGLRPGELFGLTWSAVDFQRGTIHVHASVNMDSGSPVWSDTLKNEGSLRTLTLPGFVSEALRAHGERQDAEDRPAGWTDHDLVFPNDIGGPVDLGVFRDWFRATVSALGFGDDWTPNEMRHTAASLLIDHGVPLDQVAGILGHKTTRMLETHYRHALRTERGAHVAPMEALLGQPRKRGKKKPA